MWRPKTGSDLVKCGLDKSPSQTSESDCQLRWFMHVYYITGLSDPLEWQVL